MTRYDPVSASQARAARRAQPGGSVPGPFPGQTAYTFGQLMAPVRQLFHEWSNADDLDPYDISYTLQTASGFRVLELVKILPGSEVPFRYNFMALTDEARAPARYALLDPGFNGISVASFAFSGAFFKSWPVVLAKWQSFVCHAKETIITEWTDGDVAADWGGSQLYGENVYATAIDGRVVFTPSEAMYSVEQLKGVGIDGHANIGDSFGNPPIQNPEGPLSIILPTTGIAEAISEIALMDTDISLNNGQAIYSVRGRASGV